MSADARSTFASQSSSFIGGLDGGSTSIGSSSESSGMSLTGFFQGFTIGTSSSDVINHLLAA